jgi:stage III sporulation protein AB
MLKAAGAIVILTAFAGFLQSWRENCKRRIRELEQLRDLYGNACQTMQAEHIHMPVFLERFSGAGTKKDSPVDAFAKALKVFLEERAYPTGVMAWQEAVRRTGWHLKKEELAFLEQSGTAFFGRNLSDNLKKLSIYEKQMEDCVKQAKAEFSEKNRVWTPVGLLMGAMLVVILI